MISQSDVTCDTFIDINAWVDERNEDRRARASDKKMSIQGRNLSDNLVSTEYFDASETDDGSPIVTVLPRFSTATSGIANVTSPINLQSSGQNNLLENLIIPLYGTIFFLSVVGNSLVLITLARNKRMRTVTNVYLLNLVSLLCFTWLLLDEECARILHKYWMRIRYLTFHTRSLREDLYGMKYAYK